MLTFFDSILFDGIWEVDKGSKQELHYRLANNRLANNLANNRTKSYFYR